MSSRPRRGRKIYSMMSAQLFFRELQNHDMSQDVSFGGSCRRKTSGSEISDPVMQCGCRGPIVVIFTISIPYPAANAGGVPANSPR